METTIMGYYRGSLWVWVQGFRDLGVKGLGFVFQSLALRFRV